MKKLLLYLAMMFQFGAAMLTHYSVYTIGVAYEINPIVHFIATNYTFWAVYLSLVPLWILIFLYHDKGISSMNRVINRCLPERFRDQDFNSYIRFHQYVFGTLLLGLFLLNFINDLSISLGYNGIPLMSEILFGYYSPLN